MRRTKVKILSLFLLTILIFSLHVVFGERTTIYAQEDDFEYSISADTVTIIKYTGNAETVIVPSAINGYRVTKIGDRAFSGCENLKEITLPEGITSIGESAFDGCNLIYKVTLPKSIESISGNPFEMFSIKIVRGYSGTVAESYAEKNGYKFIALDSAKKNDSYYYEIVNNNISILEYIGKDKKVVVPDKIGNYQVADISEYSFYKCEDLTEITIPEGVTTIGQYAFNRCTNLAKIDLPKNMTSIGDRAFEYCDSLTNIELPKGITNISFCLFAGCVNLKEITVPEGVTNIDKFAFFQCFNMTEITLPDGLKSIDMAAFSTCNSLTKINLPESLQSIGEQAFGDCDSLIKIVLPDGVTSIGEGAFINCDNLTEITFPKSLTKLSDNTLYMCSKIEKITLPDGLKSIGRGAFELCNSLTEITLPDGLTYIDGAAFSGCSSLTKITLPKDITSIGDYMFEGCTNLKEIVIPENVTIIDDYAFNECNSLSKVVIPRSVTSIGRDVFCKTSADMVIYGYTGTVTESYAKNNDFIFVSLDEDSNRPQSTYIGDVNTELKKFSYDNNTNYLSGQIVVVEWVDTDGDGIKESTVPKYAPKMQFVSTDGTETIDVFVTPTGTNTYYFDRLLAGLTEGKEYVFKVTSGNPDNVSPYKTVPIYTGTSAIGSEGILGTVGNQKLTYGTAADGTLLLSGKKPVTYNGNVNSLLTNVSCVTSGNGNFVSGNIIITEWIDGVSTVPKTTPKMTFESSDGTEVNEVFMACLDGTNTYYFDRNLNGNVDTTKEYIFRITLTEPDNVSAHKTMVATTNEMSAKEGILWETDTQEIRYKTVWADMDNQLRVYAVNKAAKPVDLFSVQTLFNEVDEWAPYVFNVKDNVGNYYTSVRLIDYTSYSGYDSITFMLDGKYKTLKGNLILSEECKSYGSSKWMYLEFSENGKVIGTTDKMAPGVRPFEYEIDVTGVQDLTITPIYSGAAWGSLKTYTTGMWLYK